MEKWKKLLNRETLLYLVFGVATTVVNYIVFFFFYEGIFDGRNGSAANAVAFVAAVVFAFIVNKMYVFESKSWAMEALRREVPPFLAARVGSFLIEEAGMILCESVLLLGDVVVFEIMDMRFTGIAVAKIILSVVVVVLNYVFCKFFIFKK